MTLFIQRPRRVLEISDAYVMLVSFLIFFAIGKILKSVGKKLKENGNKNIKISNPRGGDFGFEFADDTELASVILTCITNNKRYLVKDPKLINVVFALVKGKIKNESLVLTPNMLRFLALKLIKNDQTLIVRIGNVVVSTNNRVRLMSRIAGSAVIGLLTSLAMTIPYGIFMVLLYFDATQNCGYKCSNYFEELPRERVIRSYKEESNGHIFIAGNDDARQIELYTPSETPKEVAVSPNGELKTTRTYKKARKKAKLVKFSDFKQTDPVLSSFKDLKEPEVPQKNCLINEHNDLLDIRVD